MKKMKNKESLSRILKIKDENIHPLKGDASDRKYFRIETSRGESIVAMVQDSPFDKSLPFIQTQAFLKRNSISVPDIIEINYRDGIILLSDCGDNSLGVILEKEGFENCIMPYAKCIDELLKIHSLKDDGKSGDIFKLAFDHDKLMWELEFFVKHTLEGYFSIKLNKKDLRILLQRFSDICGILEREPKVVTHRDYHSRNIFLKDGEIHVLDFQDARLGPRQYDLCSLLRDSYFSLPAQSRERLIYYYLDKACVPLSDFTRFFKIFDIMSFQRNLKAAGTFGYMSVIKNKKTYAKYLPRTFNYIWEYSSGHDELKEAAEILRKYISY